jgi:hypothetical protein
MDEEVSVAGRAQGRGRAQGIAPTMDDGDPFWNLKKVPEKNIRCLAEKISVYIPLDYLRENAKISIE